MSKIKIEITKDGMLEFFIRRPKRVFFGVKNAVFQLFSDFFIFLFLLFLYLLNSFVLIVMKHPVLPKFIMSKFLIMFSRFYYLVTKNLEKNREQSISRMDLIELSLKNMKVKKARTLITVGGVSIGMGAIVFLVSLGYGVQKLVISRVARLDELRQADISTQPGGKVKINDKTMADIKGFGDVAEVMPMIAVVGRVNYQNSVSDMAVYGVTSQYLKQSAIKTVQGRIFESDALSASVGTSKSKVGGEVAGAQTSRQSNYLGGIAGDISFNIYPGEWIRVREGPTTNAKVLGYTKRADGPQFGTLYWGSTYISTDDSGSSGVDGNGEKMGKWVKSKVLLWSEGSCEKSDPDCSEGKYSLLRNEDGDQMQKDGYFALVNVSSESIEEPKAEVLGDSTVAASELDNVLAAETVAETTQSTESSDWVELLGEGDGTKAPDVKKVPLSQNSIKEAVVNRAMVSILGLKDDEAIGKKFSTTFVVTENLLEDKAAKVESIPDEYTIVGVIPDDKTPVFYVPFMDLRSLGIANYSQLKVVAKETTMLTKVRTQIEAMGYLTQSVADTVEQINNLFGTVRLILGTMGMIALAVAALGMFNTLTVSLLERTREVGLMKAMGMKSGEIQELFMTESIIMGLAGGIFGLVIGFLLGKILGLLLTSFALFKGGGFIDVSYVPPSFVSLIMILSFIVGLVTGLFPSRRAKKISALNALRYE